MPIFYIVIIFVQLAFFGQSQNIRGGRTIELFGITVTSILLAARTGVGADLATYQRHYEIIKSGYLPLVEFPEMGYRLFEHSLAELGVSFYIFLFLISFFNVHTYCKFIKFQGLKNPTLALFIYLGLFELFIYSLSAIRQSIAISFVLLAIIAYSETKKKISVFFLLLATAFHWTAIVMLPAIFIFGEKKVIKARTLLLLILFVPSVYYVSMNSSFIIGKLSSINYNMNYYLSLLADERSTSSVAFVIGISVAVIWVAYKLFFIKSLDNSVILKFRKVKNLSVNIDMTYVDWFVFIFLLLHACVDLIYVSAIPRVEMYFYMLLPIFIARELEKMNSGLRILCNILIVFFVLIQLYLKIQTNSFFYGDASFIFPF